MNMLAPTAKNAFTPASLDRPAYQSGFGNEFATEALPGAFERAGGAVMARLLTSGETRLVIDVTGLTKTFGERKVVDNFDIKVPRGAIYGFLGPNGSGKTTTIRMLCGLLTPDGGEGTCLGFDVRRQAGLIKPQDPAVPQD